MPILILKLPNIKGTYNFYNPFDIIVPDFMFPFDYMVLMFILSRRVG